MNSTIFSRNRVRAALVACSASVVFAVAVPAFGAPQFVRLSYTGDTSSTVSITWNTDADTGSEVRFGASSGSLSSAATGTSFQTTSGLGWVHEVTLDGLQSGATYYYSAGDAADGFSTEHEFTTGPSQDASCGSLRFAFLGDNRPDPTFGGGENWPQILGQSVQQNPAFVLNGGDLVIDGDQIDQWRAMLGWTEAVASSRPFMPAIGNHDTGPGSGDSANYNQLFALPRSAGPKGSGTEDYYYFTYGNAIFVALSTEGFSTGAIPFADQAAWLDQVLTDNPRKWKIVFYHKPTYTHEAFFSISHAPNEAGQNDAFVSMFDKHHVDVVFTSHNHWYERYEPSACGTQGNAGSTAACSVGAGNYAGGTVYYVSGGAGAFTIPAMLCGSETGRVLCSGDHHYIVADIQNEVMRLDTWGAAPQTNQIIDSITISKPADVCDPQPDAGPPEAGPSEAGPPDASPDSPAPLDAAVLPDGSDIEDAPAVLPDAPVEASVAQDASEEAGVAAIPEASSNGGCGCSTPVRSASGWSVLGIAAVGFALRSVRRRR